MKFHFSSINLGCNKNLVDLEYIMGEILNLSAQKGLDVRYIADPESKEAKYVLINTCGFLSTSREEAEATIRYYDDLGKKIVIIGCYLQVADKDFLDSLKHLHAIIPFVDYASVLGILGLEANAGKGFEHSQYLKGRKLGQFIESISSKQSQSKAFVWKGDEIRAYVNRPFGYEYLKIAEGCDNKCSFCIIPKIRGGQSSRSIEDIVAEAKAMIANDIKEIILIAQDTTRYGKDLYGRPSLIELLEALDAIEGDFRFRLLYMYPDNLTAGHVESLKKLKRFIPYFDIPFQHISEPILKRMGRFYDKNQIHSLLDMIAASFERPFLRTSFIVGFPGETDEDFAELFDFVSKYRFDAVALFEYHDEPLAASSRLDGKVPAEISIGRIRKLDALLGSIQEEKDAQDAGRRFEGTIEAIEGKMAFVRRDVRAPEIDELDRIPLKSIPAGERSIGARVIYSP